MKDTNYLITINDIFIDYPCVYIYVPFVYSPLKGEGTSRLISGYPVNRNKLIEHPAKYICNWIHHWMLFNTSDRWVFIPRASVSHEKWAKIRGKNGRKNGRR